MNQEALSYAPLNASHRKQQGIEIRPTTMYNCRIMLHRVMSQTASPTPFSLEFVVDNLHVSLCALLPIRINLRFDSVPR
jgi:hypothetical protein